MSNYIETNDVFGARVICTDSQWDKHITLHSIMKNNKTAVIDTINSPDIVHKAKEYDDRKVFFKKSDYSTFNSETLYTKVIVSYSTPNEGEIVTAFPVPGVKGGIGDVIYTK
jgi:hypothetical protein